MYHIIVNPASRSGRGIKIWQNRVEPALKREGIRYKVYFSTGKGDVTKAVNQIMETLAGEKESREKSEGREESESREEPERREEPENREEPERREEPESREKSEAVILLLGGDGTMNEAVQAIPEDRSGPSVIFGYIPTGSSNDLARALKIPSDPCAALDLILYAGQPRLMDLGTVAYPDGRNRRFCVSCGMGYDAAVCQEAQISRAKAVLNRLGLGKLIYLGIALKQLFTTKKVSCRLTLDGGAPIPISRMLFVAGMNQRFEGGGFMFCPRAEDDDGILELCAVGNVSRLLVLFALPTAFFGKHYRFQGITAYRARRFTLEAEAPLWIHTDGETDQRYSRITVSCQPGAVKIIAPRQGSRPGKP